MEGALDLLVVRLDPDLALPAYAKPGDAGLDLVARSGAHLAAAGGRAIVPTGIAIELPEGFAGLILPRSGLAARHGISCLNAPGLIDSGYRDELKVILVNHDPVDDYEIRRGDRIAQLVVQAVERVRWREVSELSESDRGAGGFGHTGR
ncbi:MAG: dUTP diphosphatase [Acidimicrobiales bacterium]